MGPQKITEKVPSFVKDRHGTCPVALSRYSLKPAAAILFDTPLVLLINSTSVSNSKVLHWLSQTLLQGAYVAGIPRQDLSLSH